MKFHAWFQSKCNHHYWSLLIRLKTCKFQFYTTVFLKNTVRSEREEKNCSCISYWKWFTLEFKSIKCEICEFMKRICRLVKSERSIHLCVCSDSKNNIDYKCHRNKNFLIHWLVSERWMDPYEKAFYSLLYQKRPAEVFSQPRDYNKYLICNA